MEALTSFALQRHDGPYELWPLKSALIRDGVSLQKAIPGFVINAQYRCSSGYLFVTSWDCPFEESLEIVLTNQQLEVVDRKSIGALYSSTWLEAHEIYGKNQLLLHCGNNFDIRVTVTSTLKLEQRVSGSDLFVPYLLCMPRFGKSGISKPWWKFW